MLGCHKLDAFYVGRVDSIQHFLGHALSRERQFLLDDFECDLPTEPPSVSGGLAPLCGLVLVLAILADAPKFFTGMLIRFFEICVARCFEQVFECLHE